MEDTPTITTPAKQMRFAVSTVFHVWANSYAEAVAQAQDHCRKQDAENDDHCQLCEVHRHDFGMIKSIQIYPELKTA